MKVYIDAQNITFVSPANKNMVAWIRLDAGNLVRAPKASDEEFREAGWLYKENFVLGKVLHHNDEEITLGRPNATPANGCYEVTLAGPGNPDHRQFSAIAPAWKARGTTIEELQKSCREYITNFDLGGGNWGNRSGVVSQYQPNGKKKKLGRINYAGRYKTTKEEKDFKESLKKKYQTTEPQ